LVIERLRGSGIRSFSRVNFIPTKVIPRACATFPTDLRLCSTSSTKIIFLKEYCGTLLRNRCKASPFCPKQHRRSPFLKTACPFRFPKSGPFSSQEKTRSGTSLHGL
jgi:hypothetical protein